MDLISESNGHILTFNEAAHRYTLDGRPTCGVTTFVKNGMPTGEALISWMAGQAAEHMWNLKEGGTDLKKLEAIKVCKTAHKAKSKAAADVGTIIHDFAYWLEKEDEEKVKEIRERAKGSEDWDKIAKAMHEVEKWASANRDTEKVMEEIVASVEHNFSGKFDYLAKRSGIGWVLSDHKTSGSIYPSYFVQAAAYGIAIREWLGIKVSALEILRFGKDGAFERIFIKSEDEIQSFEQAAIRAKQTYDFAQKYDADLRFRKKWGK